MKETMYIFLQMFGSIVPLLDDSTSETGVVDCRKVCTDYLLLLFIV
jgi:hypothetical protein